MTALFHMGDVIVVLALLFAGLIGGAVLLRYWVKAIADLLWMALLARRLTLEVVLACAFVILTLFYELVPQKGFAPVALPLFLILLLTPILAVPIINWRARRRYDPAAASFEVDPKVIAQADVFSLEQMRLLSVYRAPESGPAPTRAPESEPPATA